LSVRALINGLEQQKFVLFVEARGLSHLRAAANFGEFLAQWKNAQGPTRTELQALEAELSSHGVSIKFISGDRRVLALSGVFGPSEGVQTVRITDRNFDGAKDVATGTIGLGGVLIAIGAFPEPLSPFFIGAGVAVGFASGFLIGEGIVELTEPEPGQSPPPQSSFGSQDIEGGVVTIPEVVVYGSVPSGVDASNVVEIDPVDLIDIPEEPPEEPPEPGTGTPEGPDF